MKKHNRKNKVGKKERNVAKHVRKPTGKTPFRKPGYSFQENTEIYPNQTGCEMGLVGSLRSPVGSA